MLDYWFVKDHYVRIVQSDPLYPDAHEQFPGAEHVPPFEQTGTHTAKRNTNMNNIHSITGEFLIRALSSTNRYVRIVQSDPVYPDAHKQVPGPEHVPPFEHTGEQTAKPSEYK